METPIARLALERAAAICTSVSRSSTCPIAARRTRNCCARRSSCAGKVGRPLATMAETEAILGLPG
ncbi:MAG: hypothetical protein R3E53_13395 [Myxococcota bacterium]